MVTKPVAIRSTPDPTEVAGRGTTGHLQGSDSRHFNRDQHQINPWSREMSRRCAAIAVERGHIWKMAFCNGLRRTVLFEPSLPNRNNVSDPQLITSLRLAGERINDEAGVARQRVPHSRP